MEIMTREEYADLQHFPRARRKYFDHTMQPNRFIFNEDRARTRDLHQGSSERQTLFYGGKGDAFVADRSGANTNAKRKQDLHNGLDNTVLYNKRVGGCGSRLPPYTDMKNFSRTRQAYFNQDYIRDRAANTLSQDPHRKRLKVPQERDLAQHSVFYNYQDTVKDLQRSASTNDSWNNSPQKMHNSMMVPRQNQFNDTNGDMFMSQVNNREAWSKNVGNANMIRRNFVREKGNRMFGGSGTGHQMSVVENPNDWQRKVNNRENGGKFMGSAQHYVNNTKSYPKGAPMINTVY